tara:strand:- start:1137 stop:1352 length:216 start_codon:yes stop_codon:yes gene_type:complete
LVEFWESDVGISLAFKRLTSDKDGIGILALINKNTDFSKNGYLNNYGKYRVFYRTVLHGTLVDRINALRNR